MSFLFISYSSKDRDLITALVNDLDALGHDLWFDSELTGTGGQKWWMNILANVRECDAFIFGLTPNSLSSEPCRREYGYAHALCKRIIPVMLETVDVAVLPAALQEIQFVDYRERSAKQGIALAATLNNLPPPRPMPDPLPPEPETPLPPLAHLSQRLDAPSLNSTEQIEIVFNLETLFNDASTHTGAETLLRKLYAREDLTNRVAERIRSLLPDRGSSQTTVPLAPDHPEKSEKPEKKETRPVAQSEPKTVTLDPKERHHSRRLVAYFIIPIVFSGLYVLLTFSTLWAVFSHPVFGVFGAALTIISLFLTWKWKRLGIYLLSLSIIYILFCYFILFLDSSFIYNVVYWYMICIIVVMLSLMVLWVVVRDEWDSFQASPFRRIDKLFSGKRTQESISSVSQSPRTRSKRGLWLWLFLLIPGFASIWIVGLNNLLFNDVVWQNMGYVNVSLVASLATALLVGTLLYGAYGTWKWRKWGIWLLRIGSILFCIHTIYTVSILHRSYYDDVAFLNILDIRFVINDQLGYNIISIMCVLIFIIMSWLVFRDKWQFFQDSSFNLTERES